MTTTITLHVNGRYKAQVKQDDGKWVEVHGNYEGSPNPDGKATFNLRHATSNKLVINEEAVPDPRDGVAQGSVIEVGLSSKPNVETQTISKDEVGAIDGKALGMTDDLKVGFTDEPKRPSSPPSHKAIG